MNRQYVWKSNFWYCKWILLSILSSTVCILVNESAVEEAIQEISNVTYIISY
jgi:hypothetical protein